MRQDVYRYIILLNTLKKSKYLSLIKFNDKLQPEIQMNIKKNCKFCM